MILTTRYNAPMPSPRNIIVFLPNWVGDVVMATPALRALRESFRDARITHTGREIVLQTLDGTGWADEVLEDRSSRPFGMAQRCKDFWGTASRVRAGRFDLGVLFPNSFRAALLGRAGGLQRLAGYDRDGRGWMLTDKISPPRNERGSFEPVPTIDYYLRLVKMLGVRCDSRKMELGVTESEEQAAARLLEGAGVDPSRPLVMLNPGASFGTSKMWNPRRFAVVADALIERRGAQIVVNAAPSERAIAKEVGDVMRCAPAVNFADCDNTIGLLKALVRRCALLITSDTGPRHFAAAFGIGVVTLFGSTDPRWAQIDYPLERIVRVEVPCSPCQKKICPLPAGPTYHQCMGAITPEMVLRAAEELLEIVHPPGEREA